MLSEFPTEPRELPWQPKLSKINQNSTDFSSLQDMETMLACIGFLRSANTNMLIKILKEQRELPQQPNLHKMKTKKRIQIC